MVVENIEEFHNHHYSAVTQLKQALAGGVSGFLTRSLTQPFDVLKIRFQLQVEPVGLQSGSLGKYTSIGQACKLIYKEEGLLAFWKGHNSGQLLTISYTLVQFWSYEQIDLKLKQYDFFNKHMNFTRFLSGGLAGCLGTVVSMPFDVVRTRVVGQDHDQKHTSVFRLFPVIIKQDGIRGLFRGLGTTLIQIGPLIGFNFMFYHQCNELLMKFLKPVDNKLPVFETLFTGALAGVASKAVLYPLDFIKKRLQLQGFLDSRKSFGRNHTCVSITNCIKLTYADEGLLGFYKGMYPTLIKSGLTTALYFSFYEAVNNLLKIDKN